MKRVLSLAVALMLALSLIPAMADGADGSLEAILAKGELVMGLDDTFAPMGFRDENGEVVGFDIDLAMAVCEVLGVDLVIQPIDWVSKEMELDSGNVDCLWNGFSITDERLAAMSLTQAYMNNAMALVSADASCVTPEGLAGKSLGVQAASYAEKMILSEDWAELYESLGEVVGFDEYATAFLDLQNGQLDAILVDTVYARYTTGNLEGTYIVGEGLEDDLYAVGFRKADVALRDRVDEILTALREDGTMAELSVKWIGEDLIAYPETAE